MHICSKAALHQNMCAYVGPDILQGLPAGQVKVAHNMLQDLNVEVVTNAMVCMSNKHVELLMLTVSNSCSSGMPTCVMPTRVTSHLFRYNILQYPLVIRNHASAQAYLVSCVVVAAVGAISSQVCNISQPASLLCKLP